LTYLSTPESGWNHTLLGWTGEIDQENQFGVKVAAQLRADAASSLLKAAAPVPLNGQQKQAMSELAEGVQVTTKGRRALETQLERNFNGKIVPVWLPDSVDKDSDTYLLKDQRRWRRYAERELYSLFHYKQNEPSDGRYVRKSWADYYLMNKRFADRILDVYKPGDIVFIHDYQLFLVPSFLKQKIPKIYIGFFLHVPFPSSELYRCLSRRKEILEGVLGANMIGFQSYGYSRHFSSCCTRILGYESSSAGVDAYGRHVAVDVFPVGINAAAMEKAAFDDPIVEQRMEAVRKLYSGKKIIVGRDRLSAVRGVAQKLQAFERFLETYPEWVGKVVLVQITSGNEVNTEQEADDKKYITKVAEFVSKINGRFGSLSYAPVQHLPHYVSKEEYLALLRVADLGLITSVRDGMNTTSLEYVICQKNNQSPLILSEFSGTAGNLAKAIHVNPWDFIKVADEINKALNFTPEQRRVQHEKLYQHVLDTEVKSWNQKFLGRLLTNLSSFDQSFATPLLDRAGLLHQYRASERRLFMFDYDGTLTPIVKDPNAAIPSDRVVRTIKTLCSDPGNSVWIISGRDQEFLDEYLGHIPELGLSAEHGSFVRQPYSDTWENIAAGMDLSWRDEVKSTFDKYTEKTQGSNVEVKKIALTWHYRRADPDYGAFQARECQRELEATVARKYDVEVMTGKANLEVRPRFVNKGEIAKKLISEYHDTKGEELQFVLCLGDDFTDEGVSQPCIHAVLLSYY
jgi:trehalose 6-phosphate synthase/phosphatase